VLNLKAETPFDALVAIESVAHIADKTAFFKWASTSLRTGGRLGMAAWLSAEEPGDIGRRHLLEPICAEGRLPSLCTMAEYQTMALSAGFAIEHAADVTRNVRRTWLLIASRVARRLLVDSEIRALLFDQRFESRVFARTVIRLLIAYYSGVMRYGILVLRKLP
jgi:tocopherol O-methyltransferase